MLKGHKAQSAFLSSNGSTLIDSGGQPQFHEVLPAFIRNTTATIFVMKLSERLDEHPMIEYYDLNGELCGKPYRHALSNEQCFSVVFEQFTHDHQERESIQRPL